MTGRPVTRGNLDDPDIVAELCRRLIDGDSLRDICQDPLMPASTTVYERIAKDDAFRSTIGRAREAQQHAEVDRTIDLADEANADNWQVKKLQIWARQWRAAKLAPKVYGDKATLEHTGPNGGPVVTASIVTDDPAEAARAYQRIISGESE